MTGKFQKPFILAVNGSPKKNGRVNKMLDKLILEFKRTGIAITIKRVDLVNFKILPHAGKLNSKIYIEKTKDAMPKLQKLVLKADGIVFASPTHWFSPSVLMKNFIDRLTSLEHYNFLMEGKVAGFITYGPQGGALNNAMLMTMVVNHMGMSIPPYAAIFDEGRNDKWLGREYAVLAKNMLNQIRVWKELKINWGYPNAKYKISPIELINKNTKD